MNPSAVCLHSQEATAEYRATMISNVQMDIERTVMEIAMLKEERSREGHASKSTTALNQRIQARCQKVRKQVAIWKGWHTFMTLNSAAAEAQAPVCDEEKLVQKGEMPWVQALSSDTVSKEQLQLRMHRAQNELARTVEEQAWFPSDAANIVLVYLLAPATQAGSSTH